MIFEEFLRDLRKEKGLTQQELANMLFISEKTLSGYENSRRQCTFNFAMEILNTLNTSILIENNKIKLVNGDVKMTKNYENNDLNFINFNVKEFIEKIQDYRANATLEAKKYFAEAYAKNNSLGIKTTFTSEFSEDLWIDENYEHSSELAFFEKDGKKMSLMVLGHFDANMFIIERFIELIKEEHNKSIADFINKAVLYTVSVHNNGSEIYEKFHNKDIVAIIKLIPMLENYKDIINNILTTYYNDIFVNINGGYNNKEITIANDLGMYDCSSTPNIYFTYYMEDETQVVDYEAQFEGHDITDAFNYVNEYFEDYNDYETEYSHINEDWEDSNRELVIIN